MELGCWVVCFWWMHRISSRQNAVLEQLHEQGKRIEKVSTEEHEIMKELHPKVEKIEKTVGKVNESVASADEKSLPGSGVLDDGSDLSMPGFAQMRFNSIAPRLRSNSRSVWRSAPLVAARSRDSVRRARVIPAGRRA